MDGFLYYMPDIPIITLYDVFNYLITLRSDYDRGKIIKASQIIRRLAYIDCILTVVLKTLGM